MVARWRTEVIGDCVLHNADCRDVMETIGKVDAVVTDPPYEVTPTSITHYKPGGMIKGGWMGKSYPVGVGKMFETPEFSEWMQAVFDSCAENADGYFFTNDRNLPDMYAAAIAAGWKHHNILIWQKPNGTPNRWYFKDTELILYFFKGHAKTIRNPSSTTVFKCGPPSVRVHNSQKPTALKMHYIANSSDVGDTILDPFMGSGTTGVACVKLGRKFIGIEIDPGYFDIACRRIEQAYKQPDFFVEPPKKCKPESFI